MGQGKRGRGQAFEGRHRRPLVRPAFLLHRLCVELDIKEDIK
jgi:hypothetical protein